MSEATVSVFLMFTTTSHLNDSPSLEWSADDFICLLTEKGAFVFTPEFSFADSTNSLYPHKHLIPNPVDPDPSGVAATVKRFISSQQAESAWFQHIHLTDNFAIHYSRYQLASWSPRMKQFGSILALLTYDHRLMLHVFQNNEWKQLADCSKILDTQLGDHYRGISALKAYQLYAKLAVESICFSEIFELDGVETVLLLSPSQSGHCHLFRIQLTNWMDNEQSGENDCVRLVATWKSGLGSISYCSWYRHFMLLCSLDGRLIIYKLSGQSIDPRFNTWDSLPKVAIWSECDSIAIQNIIMKETGSKRFRIIFSKNENLIMCQLEETVINGKETLSLVDCISVIKTQSTPYITGMDFLPNDGLILSSPNSLITTMKVVGSQIKDQSTHPINNDEVASNMSPLSLKSSRNNVLTCVGQMITKLHDHLLLKEPTRIIIFPNKSFDELTLELENMINDPDLDAKYESLHDVMDLLNCLRGYYINNCMWIPRKLKEVSDCPSEMEETLSELGSLNLRILRFVALSVSQNNISMDKNAEEYAKVVIRLETMILGTHVKRIYSKFIGHQEEFDENQRISFYNIRTWARKSNLIKEPIAKEVTQSCPICNEKISMEDPKEALCPSNHRLVRCCNSLIVCDLDAVQYQPCKLCGRSLFAVPSVWKDYWECLYCFN